MLVQCWASVAEVVPALNHLRLLMPCNNHPTQSSTPTLNQCWCVPIRHETLTQCCFNVGPSSATLAHHLNNTGSTSRIFQTAVVITSTANARCWTDAGLMLGQRRRRWPSIKPTLFQHLAFTGAASTIYRRNNPITNNKVWWLSFYPRIRWNVGKLGVTSKIVWSDNLWRDFIFLGSVSTQGFAH